MNEFTEGGDAYCRGESRESNPYATESNQHEGWNMGWNDARDFTDGYKNTRKKLAEKRLAKSWYSYAT